MRKGKLALDRYRVFSRSSRLTEKRPKKNQIVRLATRISKWADDLTDTEKQEDGVFADA